MTCLLASWHRGRLRARRGRVPVDPGRWLSTSPSPLVRVEGARGRRLALPRRPGTEPRRSRSQPTCRAGAGSVIPSTPRTLPGRPGWVPPEGPNGPLRGSPERALAPLCIVCLPFQHPFGPRAARWPRRSRLTGLLLRSTTPPTDPRFGRPPRSPLTSTSTRRSRSTSIGLAERTRDRLDALSAVSYGISGSLRHRFASLGPTGFRSSLAGVASSSPCRWPPFAGYQSGNRASRVTSGAPLLPVPARSIKPLTLRASRRMSDRTIDPCRQRRPSESRVGDLVPAGHRRRRYRHRTSARSRMVDLQNTPTRCSGTYALPVIPSRLREYRARR